MCCSHDPTELFLFFFYPSHTPSSGRGLWCQICTLNTERETWTLQQQMDKFLLLWVFTVQANSCWVWWYPVRWKRSIPKSLKTGAGGRAKTPQQHPRLREGFGFLGFQCHLAPFRGLCQSPLISRAGSHWPREQLGQNKTDSLPKYDFLFPGAVEGGSSWEQEPF